MKVHASFHAFEWRSVKLPYHPPAQHHLATSVHALGAWGNGLTGNASIDYPKIYAVDRIPSTPRNHFEVIRP